MSEFRILKLNRFIAVLLAVLMIAANIVMLCPAEVYAVSSSDVKIGHAVHGEKGNLKGNKAGDSNGREVYIENWTYSSFSFSRYHWKCVLRAKDHDLARAIAANMTAICKNNKIGYDQNSSDNATLYDEAKKKGWDISAISKKCETTCSNAISVCLNAEGVKVPRKWYTGNMKEDLLDTGLFECFTQNEYVKSSSKLVQGDILLFPGKHAAVVVESKNPFTYKLSYKNAKGKAVSLRIEEDKNVLLNPNNGDELISIKMDSDKNLSEVQVDLKNHEFYGWLRTGERDLIACYKPKREKMKINAEKVKI